MLRRCVAVIDSGVDAGHPLVRGRGELRAGVTFLGGDAPLAGADDQLGHGTAVIAAILQQAPDAAVLPLRVFVGELSCPFAHVLAAFAHALTADVAVVNLSLGTTDVSFRGELRRLIDRAAAVGVRVVAPASAAGLACDPGALPGVDAVVADPNVMPALPELRPVGERRIWFSAPTPVQRTMRARGESLACAYVSAWLLRQPR
jgi:subtilisin family serine protease